MRETGQRDLSSLSPEQLGLLARRLRSGRQTTAEGIPRRREAWSAAPLSFAQQRLWFLDQLAPGDPAYNVACVVELSGHLDTAALERSLREVVRRHEVLRTALADTEGQPAQRISEKPVLALPRVDLSGLAPGLRSWSANALAVVLARRPFDLEHLPLLIALLLRLGPDEHRLVLVMHHIVADGWSIGVLTREMTALYGGWIASRAPSLPELPIQYADYAVWQRARVESGALDGLLAAAQRDLQGVPVLELPTDRPRSAARGHGGRRVPLRLDAATVGAARGLAKREGTSLFSVLLASLAAVLSRITLQTDLAIGSPWANRTRVEVEGLIGFFVNSMALRLDLTGEPGLGGLVRQSGAVAVRAHERQELPFERVVEALQPERSRGRNPLFQVMLALQGAPSALALPGLDLRLVEVDNRTSKLDLLFALAEEDGRLAGYLEYSSELFDRTFPARLAGHFATLLGEGLADAGRPVSELRLLSSAELHQTVVEWNDGPVEESAPAAGLYELFARRAAHAPERPAVSCGGEQLTYQELAERSQRLARHLRSLGVGPEVLVALYMERSVDLVVGLLGILAAGGAYLPLDPSYPPDRLDFMLQDSRASVLLTRSDRAGALPPFAGRIVRVDADAADIAARSARPLSAGTDEDSLAYVIYTSGSTGQPKGTLVTQGNVVRLFAVTRSFFGFAEEDVWTLFHSHAFDFSVWELWGALLYGGRVVVVPQRVSRSPGEFLALLGAERVTILNQTPSAFLALMEQDAADPRDLALRWVVFGGEALDIPALAPWFERHGDRHPALVNMYGITETTVHVTCRPLSRCDVAGGSVIGRPLADLQLHVLDHHGEPMPAGGPGELFVGGAGLSRGYLGRPQLTAGRFVPNPFPGAPPGSRLYRTGDLARRLPNGDTEYLGRIDSQVKIRGFRIELGEIESALSSHPGVARARVLVREGWRGDRRLVAYLVFRAGQEVSPGELRRALERRLPSYMVPAAYVTLGDLPLTAHGKLDVQALPAPADEPGLVDAAFVLPGTPIEETVAGVWAEILGRERPGADDDFFQLGGHSLLATQVVSRLAQVFRIELPLSALFDESTVARLAGHIEATLRKGAGLLLPSIEPVPREAPLPLSFAQQSLWILDRWEPGNPAYNMPVALRLQGALRISRLEHALTAIVARHEALRTTFPTVADTPVQRIAPPGGQRLSAVDLCGLTARTREQEALRLVGEEAMRPFDLEKGPLLRALLIGSGPDEHVACFTLHHIVSDGWSMSLLIRELMVLYTGAGELPALPVQYGDFAVWQRRALTGELLARQLDYWRARLEGSPPYLTLPTDPTRREMPGHAGASLPIEISREVSAGLLRLSRARRATLFMTLLAAYQIVLARYSGEEDVVVGCPTAGRDRLETEGLIGFFVNTLVIRADLSGNPTFFELLGKVREAVLGAYTHRDLPFDLLVESLQPDRVAGRTVLFNVLFLFQNLPELDLELPDLDIRLLPIERTNSLFDLVLELRERDGRITGSFTYSTALFAPETVAGVGESFELLLQEIVARPDAHLSDLDLFRVTERPLLIASVHDLEAF